MKKRSDRRGAGLRKATFRQARRRAFGVSGLEQLEQRRFLDGDGLDLHPDEPGPDATILDVAALTASIQGTLDSAADVDVFQFEAPVDGEAAAISFALPNELSIKIYDADGGQISEQYGGEGNPEFGLDALLPFDYAFSEIATGQTYYVSIGHAEPDSASALDYSLEFFVNEQRPPTEVDPPAVDPGATLTDAELGDDIHQDAAGVDSTVVDLTSGSAQIHSNFDREGDLDTFQFTAPYNGELFAFGISDADGQPLQLRFFNAEGDVIGEQQWLFGLGETAASVEEGAQYFVEVGSSASQVGSYHLDLFLNGPIVQPPLPTPDAVLGDDIHANSIDDGPTSLSFDSGTAQVISNVDVSGDVDLFEIAAQQDGLLFANAYSPSGELIPVVRVLSSDGELVEPRDEFALFGFPGVVPIAAGENYVIELSSNDDSIGLYQLDVSTAFDVPLPPPFEPDSQQGEDPHPNQIGDDATIIDLSQTASVKSYIDEVGDVDVFRFTAITSGTFIQSLPVAAEGSLADLVELTVVDQDGAAVDTTTLVNSTDPFVSALTQAGEDYYVLVSSQSDATGLYHLNVAPFEIAPPVAPPLIDPDSQFGDDIHADEGWENATTLGQLDLAGSLAVDTFIDDQGDRDLFAFSIAESVDVVVSGYTASGGWGLGFVIFDANGQPLGRRGQEAENDNLLYTIFEANLEPGEYYLRAEGIDLDIPAFFDETGDGVIDADDVAVGEYLIDFAISVPVEIHDSQLGDDPHADEVGEAATPIELDGGFFEVTSYLDEPGDVDVFQFELQDQSDLFVSSWDLSYDYPVGVQLYRADGEAILQPEDPIFGFLGISNGYYRLDAGSYFVAVQEIDWLGDDGLPIDRVAPTDYTLQLSASAVPVPVAPAPINPDAPFGQDAHADVIGDDATLLELSDEAVEIDSYLDSSDDVDVFRFEVDQTSIVTISALFPFGTLPAVIELADADGGRVETGSLGFGFLGLPFDQFDAELEPGTYYLSLATWADQPVARDIDGDGVDDPLSEYQLWIERQVLDGGGEIDGPVVDPVDELFGLDPDADFLWEQPTPLAARPASQIERDAFIDSAGDVDMFEFVAESDATLSLRVEPSTSEPLMGDVNGDGLFDSADLVRVFTAGHYEVSEELGLELGDATWDDGDWNGDGVVTSSDLVVAFQAGHYEDPNPTASDLPLEYLVMNSAGAAVGHSHDESTHDEDGNVRVQVEAGETYFLMVAAEDREATGRYRLSLG